MFQSLNYILLGTLLVLSFGKGNCQTTIKGNVQDQKGEKLVGVNIFVKGTYDGTSSDMDGSYAFQTNATGDQFLEVRYIGYYVQTIPIHLEATSVQEFNIELKPSINKLEAVVISAGTFSAGEDNNREVLKPLDIATTAGATADISGALNTLPGTQKVGETGRLFVRGGDGYETKTFIDGAQVLNAYGPSAPNTASRNRFSPFMFKGTSFSTGGYSAEYGQALSSVLVLNTKGVANEDRGDISLMTVGGSMAGTKNWKDNALSGKISYTNLKPYFLLVPQDLKWEKAPESIEGNVAYRKKLKNDAMFKVYGNFNTAAFDLYQKDLETLTLDNNYQLTNRFYYLNASYKDYLNAKTWAYIGTSYTRTEESFLYDYTDDVQEKEQGYHAKFVVGSDVNDRLGVKGGLEFLNRNHTMQYRNLNSGTTYNPNFNENITASFLEADYFFSNNLVARAGIRMEHQKLVEAINWSPRVSLGYKLNAKGQVSLAYGQFNQSATSEHLRINPQLQQERANHLIANYQHISANRTFRVEVYQKLYDQLVKFSDMDAYNATLYNNQGTGYARGLDLFWRDNKTFKNVDYWVSYSFLDTERNYRNYPTASVPTFASTHNFSIVMKHFITDIKTQVGASYGYNSPRKYHDPNKNGFNNSETKHYHDFSANLSYLYKPTVILHLSVSNVFGLDQEFSYQYAQRADENGVYKGQVVQPPAKRFVFLGVFITLSKNKTLNQLPIL